MKLKFTGNKLITGFLVLFLLGLFGFQAAAQTKKSTKTRAAVTKKPVCRTESTIFRCSEDFLMDEAVDKNTVLLKGTGEYSAVYLFVSTPGDNFDEDKVKNRIAKKLSLGETKEFTWRDLGPGLMDLESSFEKTQKSSVGFDGTSLIHFISRQFNFKNRNIIVGYGYRPVDVATKPQFEGWLGGDQAMGCNEIATIVNSITKEFKEAEQYCTLTIAVPKKS